MKKKQSELFDKFHSTIGVECIKRNFKRKGNVYFRVYGDNIFQIIAAEKFVDEARVLVHMMPLYSVWQCEKNHDTRIGNILMFEFKAIATHCYGFDKSYEKLEFFDDELIDFFINEYMKIIDNTDTAVKLFEQLKIMNKIYNDWDMDDEEIEEEEKFDLLYPELKLLETNCDNQDMAYIALYCKDYVNANNYIKYTYERLKGLIEMEIKNGSMCQECGDSKINALNKNMEIERTISKLIEENNIEAIEVILQKNIKNNKQYLRRILKLDI